MFQIDQIYNLLKYAVKHMTGSDCQVAKTFAVLQSMSELSTENLSKWICDMNLPYFYSKTWEALSFNPSDIVFDWPALTVFEENFISKNPFAKKNGQKRYNLQLHFLDKYAENDKHTDCTGCKGRVINQIYSDTEAMADKVFAYIYDSVHITLNTNDLLLNRTYYEWLIAQIPNTLAGSVLNEVETNRFKGMLLKENKDLSGFRSEGKTASTLYGTIFPLRVCLDTCNEEEIEISNFVPVKIPDRGCCY